MFISGQPGEKLSIKPEIDDTYKKALYSCLYFKAPIFYNNVTVRDESSIDGGVASAHETYVVFNSMPLAVALIGLWNQGSTIKEIVIIKLTYDMRTPKASLVPQLQYKFEGITVCGIAIKYGENNITFEGSATNSYVILKFDFDSIILTQRLAHGKDVVIVNKGSSNKHSKVAYGK